ncbi:MAG: nucleotidyltransferase domain-containing protein [Candidatus Micrarchaeota archaeon]
MKSSSLRTIRRILGKHNVKTAALFGSTARVEERAGSDVDILFAPPPGFSLFDMARMKNELELSRQECRPCYLSLGE